jgi:hydrogenase maturation protease
VPRTTPLTQREAVGFAELELSRYEGERPAEGVACRVGDERFFPSST